MKRNYNNPVLNTMFHEILTTSVKSYLSTKLVSTLTLVSTLFKVFSLNNPYFSFLKPYLTKNTLTKLVADNCLFIILGL